MASIKPQENADKYPEPTMFGDLSGGWHLCASRA